MQEEVTGKAVALIIDGAKMSEQVLEKALQKFLEAQKNKSSKMHRGKQTLKQLAGQNAGLANIEISDKNIRAFTNVAKKYHVDFALKRTPPPSSPATWSSSKAGMQTPSRRPSRSSQAGRWAGMKSPPSGSGWHRQGSRRRRRWNTERLTGRRSR